MQLTLTAGTPHMLFEGAYRTSSTNSFGYDVAPDGQRFLMIQNVELERAATQINVVLNWLEELKQKVRGQSGKPFINAHAQRPPRSGFVQVAKPYM